MNKKEKEYYGYIASRSLRTADAYLKLGKEISQCEKVAEHTLVDRNNGYVFFVGSEAHQAIYCSYIGTSYLGEFRGLWVHPEAVHIVTENLAYCRLSEVHVKDDVDNCGRI